MNFDNHVYSVLVVSSNEKFTETLKPLLIKKRYEPISYCSSIAAAKRKTTDTFYDLVIINSPLPDDTGTKFAIDLSTRKNTACLLLVKNEVLDTITAKVKDHGVYVIPKPVSLPLVYLSLDWLETTRERLRRFEQKNVSVEKRMEEIRLVNRAKWLLISKENLSEEEAHHSIEKQAMDNSVSKAKIAEEIIERYKD